ncbi:MAG: OmpA family protein [Thiobacillus sp.]|uniref:OmpA family protein n=1 Tax=Thiobacillus sp. TaxID=924 RepID=UPI0028954B01|nr:OmpA family protein [Thiobacillus sp.]MDT3706701.1 OmpA family protein [Thiobacillus sp.]
MMVSRTIFAGALLLNASLAMALDLGGLKSAVGVGNGSPLETVNKSLADQQIRDGQFEFKVGKAEFAPGNEKRIKGLLKVLTNYSGTLKVAFPSYRVTAVGHTDADGTAASNQKLSLARANKVCSELKAKGLTVPCEPVGVGSSQPLVAPEKSPADKQRNRRVLVQVTK